MELEYEKLCRITAEQWSRQAPPRGIWAQRSAYIHATKPAIVWRKSDAGQSPEDCMTIMPSWEALSHWMRGYEFAAQGRLM